MAYRIKFIAVWIYVAKCKKLPQIITVCTDCLDRIISLDLKIFKEFCKHIHWMQYNELWEISQKKSGKSA